MNADALLRELTALPYDRRFARLVELGRESRTDRDLAAVLERWSEGDWQQRQFSLQACCGSRDAARPERLAFDPSRSIAYLAVGLLAHLGDDATVLRVLGKLPKKRRQLLLTRLRAGRRFAVIDAFLDQLADAESLDLGPLLPLGSSEVVARHFERAAGTGGLLLWSRLARNHPRFAAEQIARRLAAVEQPDGLLMQYGRTVIAAVTSVAPDAALDVVRAMLRAGAPLNTLPLAKLARHRPAAVADLALASEEPAALDLGRVAPRLDQPRLVALAERQPGTLPNRPRWLERLEPARRLDLFRRVGPSWRVDGVLDPITLACLPGEARVAEARRHLKLDVLETRPLALAVYLGFLPWAEARERLEPWLTHPEAEMRSAGWSALIGATRFERSRAGELLALVRARKNEQDPVRLAFLTALAALPPGTWKAEHLDDLGQILRDALDATDLSPLSVAALTRLAFNLVPGHPAWAVGPLAVIFTERGNLTWLPLESRLTDDAARQLEAALLPVCQAWKVLNRVCWMLGLAGSMGRRLRACPQLLDSLEDLLDSYRQRDDRAWVAGQVLTLLKKYRPAAQLMPVVERLVGKDESWIGVGPVFGVLHRRRQDLLGPHLGTAKLQGVFGPVELLYLLPLSGYRRYTRPQQETLARTLSGLIRLPRGKEPPRDSWQKLRAIERLAALPGTFPERLTRLASDRRPLIAEAALRALGRLDAGQGLPTLLEALGDDRGRVAIYAVRRSLSELDAGGVLEHLRAAPMNRVTVAKEVLRLAGDYAGPAGFDWLRELDARPLHRDVRIALLRALWEHLERPEAWDILRRAAEDPDGRMLTNVVRIPADRLSEAARQRLIDLLLGLTEHGDPTVRIVVLNRFAQMPVPDPQRRPLARALGLLASPLRDERAAAAAAVLATVTAGDADFVAEATAGLLPQRRPLAEWLGALMAWVVMNRGRLRPVVGRVLGVLESDPITAVLQPELAGAASGTEGFRETVERLAGMPDLLHADALLAADRAIRACGGRPDRASCEALESALAASIDPRLRRLAVTALELAASDGRGWDAERRRRLEAYRDDSSPLVAAAAQFLFPPEE